MDLLLLQTKYPEFKVEDKITAHNPVRYESVVSFNDRVVYKVQNLASISHSHREITNYLLEYGIKTLIEQSKQP